MEVLREACIHIVSHILGRLCFNPCFDGSVERGSSPRGVLDRQAAGFNPCFDGSVERGECGAYEGPGRTEVSILVLMEVLREADAHRTARDERKYGFNPCFDGSVERGSSVIRIFSLTKMFQSLF